MAELEPGPVAEEEPEQRADVELADELGARLGFQVGVGQRVLGQVDLDRVEQARGLDAAIISVGT